MKNPIDINQFMLNEDDEMMMENMNKMQEAREAEFMKRLENKTKVEAIDKELEAKDEVSVAVKQVTIEDKPAT